MSPLQPQFKASSSELSALQKMVEAAIMGHLNNGGPALARKKLDKASDCFCNISGWTDIYNHVSTIITQFEHDEQMQAEQRQQQQMREWLMALIGASQTQNAVGNPKAEVPHPAVDLSDTHIQHCLNLLMEAKTDEGELLFNQQSHWQAVFRILSDMGMYGDDDFDFFDGLIQRVMPDHPNSSYSRQSVKNISQTLFNKPFCKWRYDSDIMKKRAPYDRMVMVAQRFLELLKTT